MNQSLLYQIIMDIEVVEEVAELVVLLQEVEVGVQDLLRSGVQDHLRSEDCNLLLEVQGLLPKEVTDIHLHTG